MGFEDDVMADPASLLPMGAGRRRASLDFGDERRRATNTLLVLNCLFHVLQLLSKGLLTFWGAKASDQINPDMQAWTSGLSVGPRAIPSKEVISLLFDAILL